MIENIEMKYSVGALLYSPALNGKVSEMVIGEKFDRPYSLALCLEDSISDDSVELAERQLSLTLKKISEASKERSFFLPMIFVRVRNCKQLLRIYADNKENINIVRGFIFPKYSLSNADDYNSAIREINSDSSKIFYMMPILESNCIVEYSTRNQVLVELKKKIDLVKEYVLNIRVGGNDFSNEFALRRNYDGTIYDMLPIAQLLGDILTVFSREYVISGAVWEFFSSDNDEWKMGLRNELKLDKINGFIGKTVIHPKQIKVVNETLKVSLKDYEDAREILDWKTKGLQVGKSIAGERMNEVKTHTNWAYKTMILAKIYGVI